MPAAARLAFPGRDREVRVRSCLLPRHEAEGKRQDLTPSPIAWPRSRANRHFEARGGHAAAPASMGRDTLRLPTGNRASGRAGRGWGQVLPFASARGGGQKARPDPIALTPSPIAQPCSRANTHVEARGGHAAVAASTGRDTLRLHTKDLASGRVDGGLDRSEPGRRGRTPPVRQPSPLNAANTANAPWKSKLRSPRNPRRPGRVQAHVSGAPSPRPPCRSRRRPPSTPGSQRRADSAAGKQAAQRPNNPRR